MNVESKNSSSTDCRVTITTSVLLSCIWRQPDFRLRPNQRQAGATAKECCASSWRIAVCRHLHLRILLALCTMSLLLSITELRSSKIRFAARTNAASSPRPIPCLPDRFLTQSSPVPDLTWSSISSDFARLSGEWTRFQRQLFSGRPGC